MKAEDASSKQARLSGIVLLCQGLLWGSATCVLPFIVFKLKVEPCDESCSAYTVSLLVTALYIGKVVGYCLSWILNRYMRALGKNLTSLYVILTYCAIMLFGFCSDISMLLNTKFMHGIIIGVGDCILAAAQISLPSYTFFWMGFGLSSIIAGVLYISASENVFAFSISVFPSFISSLVISNILLLIAFVFRNMYSSNSRHRYTPLLREAGPRGTAYDNILLASQNPSPNTLMVDGNNPDDFGGEDLQVPGRYIRGFQDYSEALERWRATLKWRRENAIDGILKERQEDFDVIKEAYPHYFHGKSIQGCPVYYEIPGKIDIKKLLENNIDGEKLLRYYVFVTEYLWKRVEQNDDAQLISVIDISGVKLTDLMGERVEFLKNASRTMQNYYVERCRLVFIINAPFFFGLIWRVISPLLHENTRRKVRILGSDYKTAMLEHISDNQIPMNYGGSGPMLGSGIEDANFISYVQSLNRSTAGSINLESQDCMSVRKNKILKELDGSKKFRHQGLNDIEEGIRASTDPSAEIKSANGGVFGLVARMKSSIAGIFTPKKQADLGEPNRFYFNTVTQTWELETSEMDDKNSSSASNFMSSASTQPQHLDDQILQKNSHLTVQLKKRAKVVRKNSVEISQDSSSGASGTDCSEDEDSSVLASSSIASSHSVEGLVDDLFEPGRGTLMMISVFASLKAINIGLIELFSLYLYFSLKETGISMHPGEIGFIFSVSSTMTVVYQFICSRIIDMKGQLFAQHIGLQCSVCMILSLSCLLFFIRKLNKFSSLRFGISIVCILILFGCLSWIQLVTQFLSKLKSEYRNGLNVLFIVAEVLGGAFNTMIIMYCFNVDGSVYAFFPYYSFLVALFPLTFLAWDMIRGRVGIVRRKRDRVVDISNS